MKPKTSIITSLAAPILLVSAAHAGTLEQSGIVSGGIGPMTQDVILNQFDDQGGTLALNSVQLDFLTSIIGGYTTTGSGVPVDIFAQLDAEWSLEGNLIADTQALIDTTVANTNMNAATVFNTDTATVLINNPGQLAAWTGNGTIALSVFTDFMVSEDPAGIINFGAGGTVRYTVIYDFSVVPAPGAAGLLGLILIAPTRRRKR